ncbi:MAG: hypothetical protein AAF346_02865 [Pseudomonadota bacterium]
MRSELAVTRGLLIATAISLCQGFAPSWAQADLRGAPKNVRELIDRKYRTGSAVRYDVVWKYFARNSYVAELKPSELAQYRTAFDTAKCSAVKRLQTIAFFRKYPFLIPVLSRPAARRSFDRIVAWRALDYVHCVYRNQVDMLLSFARHYQIDLTAIDLSQSGSGSTRKQLYNSHKLVSSSLQSRVFNSLCAAGSWFLMQAIDKRYSEGLRQVLVYYLDLKLIKLSRQQTYYLYALARSQSIVSEKRLLQLEPSYHGVSASDRILIDQYVAANDSATRLPRIYPRYCGRERFTAEFRLRPPW